MEPEMTLEPPTYAYVDGGACIRVTDPMIEYLDEDMTTADWHDFVAEMRNRRPARKFEKTYSNAGPEVDR
jgi:hypothetical protein